MKYQIKHISLFLLPLLLALPLPLVLEPKKTFAQKEKKFPHTREIEDTRETEENCTRIKMKKKQNSTCFCKTFALNGQGKMSVDGNDKPQKLLHTNLLVTENLQVALDKCFLVQLSTLSLFLLSWQSIDPSNGRLLINLHKTLPLKCIFPLWP